MPILKSNEKQAAINKALVEHKQYSGLFTDWYDLLTRTLEKGLKLTDVQQRFQELGVSVSTDTINRWRKARRNYDRKCSDNPGQRKVA